MGPKPRSDSQSRPARSSRHDRRPRTDSRYRHHRQHRTLPPKPDGSLWYFSDVLGMEVVHTEGDSVYLRGYGDFAPYTLKLTGTSRPASERRVARDQSCGARAPRQRIEAAGLGVGWSERDFGRGRTFHFRDPDGHRWPSTTTSEVRAPDELRSTLKNLPQRFTGAAPPCAAPTISRCCARMWKRTAASPRNCWDSSCARRSCSNEAR